MSERRRFSGELKARIALEALRGDRTLQEIASRHQVHPNQFEALMVSSLPSWGICLQVTRVAWRGLIHEIAGMARAVFSWTAFVIGVKCRPNAHSSSQEE